MRLAHISDLHICHRELRQEINTLAETASKELGTKVDISVATEDSLESLRRAVRDLDPDVICLTGDITTFGDQASFAYAVEFLGKLADRGKGTTRKIIVTPGNHDVLCSQLNAALRFRGSLSLYAKWVRFRDTTKRIRALLGNPSVCPQADILANYRKFTTDSGVAHNALELGAVSGKPVWCVPFDSVSVNPLWVNLGRTDREEFSKFYDRLRNVGSGDSILIALVHHNPVSSPDVAESPLQHAYNSMPGSSVLVREMQIAGVDLVLFGHQHRQTSCVIDFSSDGDSHLNLLGAASATCGDSPGFNVIDILDRFYAQYSVVTFNAAGGYRFPNEDDYAPMVFDIDRPDDPLTMCTKNEIRYFRYLEAEGQERQWNQMHIPGAKEILIVGPRLKRVMKERREELLNIMRHPQNKSLKILLSDPALYHRIEKLNEDDRSYLKGMWGEEVSWEDQAKDAQLTLQELQTFRNELGLALREKLIVRLAHTLLPIGAISRDASDPEGSMLIRLLPVGIMGGVVKRPVLRLTRRHPAAVYSFYHAYLNELWKSGKQAFAEPKGAS